jgi:hypothetical protein
VYTMSVSSRDPSDLRSPHDSAVTPPSRPTRFGHHACLCMGGDGHVSASGSAARCRVGGRRITTADPICGDAAVPRDPHWWAQGLEAESRAER